MSSTRHRNTRFIRYRGSKTIDELKNSKNLQHTFTLENFGDSKSFWYQFIAVIGVELWSNRCTINDTMVWPLLIGLTSFLFVRFDIRIQRLSLKSFPIRILNVRFERIFVIRDNEKWRRRRKLDFQKTNNSPIDLWELSVVWMAL